MSEAPAEQPNTASHEWLIEGFCRALRRLHDDAISKGDVDPMETFTPLFETLNWLAAAGVEDELPDRERQLAQGIRFVRNRVHHKWAKALHLQDMPFPGVITNRVGGSRIIYPPVVKMWCWQPVDMLPKADPGFENKHIELFYRDLLAGHLAQEALDAIAAALPAPG